MLFHGIPTRSGGLAAGTRKSPTGSSSLFRVFDPARSDSGGLAFRGEMLVPGVDFRAVRKAVSMRDVLKLVGFVARETRGEQRRGPCPIHGSTFPNSRIFSVHLARNAFRCFKCGASGNQLDLWAAVTRTDLHAATIELCRRLQIDIPWLGPK
jgi:hypothetical protein